MAGFLKNRWLLLLVLAVFIAVKIPHLPYPYYWDESWPYATAVHAMHDNGLSLLPGAIDSDLSRGHPMWFHVMAAGWMKVFGDSHIAMHSFGLFVAVLLLICVYEAAYRMFSRRAADMAVLFVALQEIFIVQSTALLPEVLIALLCFVSLWAYVKQRYALAAIFLSMLFFTKESGMMMGFVLGIDAIAACFSRSLTWKGKLSRLLAVGVPTALIGLFFLLQKQKFGWYAMPLHTEDMKLVTWDFFFYRFRTRCTTTLFQGEYRYYYFIALVILGVTAAIVRKQIRLSLVLIVGIYIWCLLHEEATHMHPPALFFILFAVLWFAALALIANKHDFPGAVQRRFIILTGSFIFCFMCFSCMSFYTPRYVIGALVPLLMLTAILMDMFVNASYRFLYYPLPVAACILFGIAIQENRGHYGDTDLGSYSAMEVMQETIDYFEKNNYYDKHISTGSYLESMHLKDWTTGFLKHRKNFGHVKWSFDDTTDLIIFNSIETDYRYEKKHEWADYHLVFRKEKDKIWSEVYQRNGR